jgi:O-acetyl-ADP-ribose deacetylase (regulator of RNase III)
MLELTRDDLLKADVDALVNTVNTVGVMGKGVALQFRNAFPENYEAYRRAAKDGAIELGRMFVFDIGKLTRPRFIINFPTKKHWKGRSRLEDIEAGLVDLVRVIRELDIKSIAVPPLGCGNGGLDWEDVRPRIEAALAPLEDVRTLLYVPSGAPAASDMKVATKRPRMTLGRAALLALLERYIEPGFGASVLEIQKLLYFMQTGGQPLRLNFAKGMYGPYAENVNHVLQDIESHYLRGYGDRSRRVADWEPLELVPGAGDEARDFLSSSPETYERINRVMDLVKGFDSPYGLELLSTVHWVATHADGMALVDADSVVKHARAWSRRKERLFTERHIRLAWERLTDQGWLQSRKVASPV